MVVGSGGMMDWGMVDWGRMRNWVGNRMCNWVCNSSMRRCRAIKNGTSKLGFASDKGEEGEDCKYLKKILNHFIEHNTNTILNKVFQIRIDLVTFFKITLYVTQLFLDHFFRNTLSTFFTNTFFLNQLFENTLYLKHIIFDVPSCCFSCDGS